MQTITLTAGTFEPGSTVSGKVVRKWHVWDTVPRYSWGNMYRSVVITFTDNTDLYATEVSTTPEGYKFPSNNKVGQAS